MPLSPAELASMTIAVAASLDQSVAVYRRTSTSGTSGQQSGPYVFSSNVACTVSKPTGQQLQAFASVIGSKMSLMLRYMPTSDIREGDRVTCNGKNWIVQYVETADSYTVTNDAVMIVNA